MKMTKRLVPAAALVLALLCLAGCQNAEPPVTKGQDLWAAETAAATPSPAPEATEAPAAPDATETPGVYGGTLLFYNPTGGEYYHLDQNCSKVGGKYLPLQGHFTYDRLNDAPYQNLKPCEACGAPRRPQ